jgi:hypothetical protein
MLLQPAIVELCVPALDPVHGGAREPPSHPVGRAAARQADRLRHTLEPGQLRDLFDVRREAVAVIAFCAPRDALKVQRGVAVENGHQPARELEIRGRLGVGALATQRDEARDRCARRVGRGRLGAFLAAGIGGRGAGGLQRRGGRCGVCAGQPGCECARYEQGDRQRIARSARHLDRR